MEEKMFMCYGVGGHKQIVYSNPHEGITEPEEIEVILNKNVKMGKLNDGSRCLFYNDIPYSDFTLSFVNNNIVSHHYRSSDEMDRPSGDLLILATIKK